MEFNLPLTIFLIKEEYKEYEDILVNDEDVKPLEIKKSLNIEGKAFVGDNKTGNPKWNNLLDNILIDYDKQFTQSTRAVLFVKRKGRIFAFTFGHGRHLIKDEAYIRNFGLKVILNNAKRSTIKSVDSIRIDEKPFQNRIQAAQASRLEEFNLNDIRTMFRAITADSINKEKYGSVIKGKDNIQITYRNSLKELNSLCDNLLKDYKKTFYEKIFPEIDRITEVKDPEIINKLNEELLINIKENKNTFLMIPDIIEWDLTEGFSYTKNGENFPAPSLDDFLEVKKIDNITIDKLKAHYMYQISSGEVTNKWSIFKSLCTEVTYNDKHYILSIGEWFEVKKELINIVNNFINNIPRCNINFPKIDGFHEKLANQYFSKKISNLLNLDRANIHIEGSSPYEVCDLLSTDKKLIHVKWWDSSATLSHLFSQGKVSGEILANDKEQRVKINNKINDINPKFNNIITIDNFSPYNFTIVYAIIYDGSKSLADRLPFFSKLNLMQAVRELDSLGYKVEVARIVSTRKRLSAEEMKQLNENNQN